MEAIDLMLEMFGYEISDQSRNAVLTLIRRITVRDDQTDMPVAVQTLNSKLVEAAQEALERLPKRKLVA